MLKLNLRLQNEIGIVFTFRNFLRVRLSETGLPARTDPRGGWGDVPPKA